MLISTLRKILKRSKTSNGNVRYASQPMDAMGVSRKCALTAYGMVQAQLCRALEKYRPGTQGVKDIAKAVRDNEKFIYAWCCECDTAKEVVKRNRWPTAPLE
ncbi:hypothetical protein AAEP93_001769 [Penicillium crustosum]